MLLTIDAGNTQTVVGLFRDARARRPLAHRDGRGTDLRRARVDGAAVPRVPRVLVREHDHGGGDLVGRAARDRRAAPDDRALFRVPGAGARTGCSHRHADPLRQPEGGRRRPDRERGRRVRPLRGPVDRRRLRNGHDDRGRERERRVSRWRDLPRRRDLDGRAFRSGRRFAEGRARRTQACHREIVGGVDPVGHDLRIQRAGRRARRSLRGRARAVRGDRDRRPRRTDHPALAYGCRTSSLGSRCSACASSSNGIADGRRIRGAARQGRGDPRPGRRSVSGSFRPHAHAARGTRELGRRDRRRARRPTTSSASRAACC